MHFFSLQTRILLVSLSVCAISPATWIGDSLPIIGDLSLKNLTIPGTHDSGSYNFTDRPLPGEASHTQELLFELSVKLNTSVAKISRDWSLTQDRNFYEQLQGGIRYLDLRSGWDNETNQWVTFHFLIGNPVEYLLLNVSKFLQDYPTEIVIIEMSHFEGFPTENDYQTLKNLVFSILGPFLYPVDLNFAFNIRDMVNSGKRAIVTMEQAYDNITIWPPNSIYNTYANTPDLKQMMAFNNNTIQQFMSSSWPEQLFKISWTLTADDKTLIDSLIPFKPKTLIQLADIAAPVLPSFWKDMKKKNWRMGNILIIDHYEVSEIVKTVWNMNGIPF